MSRSERTIIVTGGTGALGRVVVQAFLDNGDLVVVPWIDKDERYEAARYWGDAVRSGRATLIEADIATQDGANRTSQAGPEVEALINLAGGFGGGQPVYEGPLELWDQMYRINTRTAVAMSRAVLPGMLKRHRGYIINIAARAALDHPPHLAAYSASKAAVLVLTDALQKELASTNVRVHALLPATLDTPQNRAAMPNADFTTWTRLEPLAESLVLLTQPAAQPLRGAYLPV